MIKGLNRRVVVVKPSGSPIFEQAIFIMRDDIKVTEDAVIQEACATANEYAKRRCGRKREIRIPAPAFAAAGAAITGVAWIMTLIK